MTKFIKKSNSNTMEIRFRVWDKIGENMFYPKDAKFCVTMIGQTTDDAELGNPCVAYRMIPLLSTLMKDKHGKEIFIGDLLRNGSVEYPYVYEVYWDDKFQFSTRLVSNKVFMGSLSNNEYIVPEEMKYEVVGNVFQNPELTECIVSDKLKK
ncbi:MAG: YopX family protein [Nanoarchaeota archaeon]